MPDATTTPPLPQPVPSPVHAAADTQLQTSSVTEHADQRDAGRTARDRVFAAADALLAEDVPVTVTTVRERAGCSNATATTYLRAWREERAAADAEAAALPDLPRPVTHLVERGVDALWREALRAARSEHLTALGDAQSARDTAREEADRLASALDRATAERAEARDMLAAARAEAEALRSELAKTVAARDAAHADVAHRRGETEALREALAAARNASTDLQEHLSAADQARTQEAAARARAEASAVGLREALTDARSALDHSRAGHEQLRAELERTRAGLDEARAAAAQAKTDHAVAETARAAETAAASRLEAEITALREELRVVRHRAAETERSLAAETAARARSDGEVAGWRARHAAAEDGSR